MSIFCILPLNSLQGVAVNSVALSTSAAMFLGGSESTVEDDTCSPRGSSALSPVHQTRQHSATPSCPPIVPLFSCDPCDLCSVTAQREDPMLGLPWRWPWRPPVRHAFTDTLAYTLRQRRAIDILLYREGGEGGGRGKSHCRDTGEIRTGVWVCEREREQETKHLSLESGRVVPESCSVCHSKRRGRCSQDVAEWPLKPTKCLSHEAVYCVYLIWLTYEVAVRGSFKIDDPCGTAG